MLSFHTDVTIFKSNSFEKSKMFLVFIYLFFFFVFSVHDKRILIFDYLSFEMIKNFTLRWKKKNHDFLPCTFKKKKIIIVGWRKDVKAYRLYHVTPRERQDTSFQSFKCLNEKVSIRESTGCKTLLDKSETHFPLSLSLLITSLF